MLLRWLDCSCTVWLVKRTICKVIFWMESVCMSERLTFNLIFAWFMKITLLLSIIYPPTVIGCFRCDVEGTYVGQQNIFRCRHLSAVRFHHKNKQIECKCQVSLWFGIEVTWKGEPDWEIQVTAKKSPSPTHPDKKDTDIESRFLSVFCFSCEVVSACIPVFWCTDFWALSDCWRVMYLLWATAEVVVPWLYMCYPTVLKKISDT